MIRHVFAAVIAVCLIPLPAAAQTTLLTINATSADIHRSPTVSSPIIARAPRLHVLEVTRELGAWVKVSWPDAPEGAGYVRRSLGTLVKAVPPPPSAAASSAAPSSAIEPSPQTGTVRNDMAGGRSGSALNQPGLQYITPPTHKVGIGGLMNGSTIGFGATGRAWAQRRIGVQIELSRYSLTPPSTLDRVNSVQFAPSLLVSLWNGISESIWVRPYAGGGARLSRMTLTTAPGASVSENRKSWQVFGGSEFTFPGAPRFAVSTDLRYDSSKMPFAGYDFGGVGFSVSGHWYVK